MEKVNMKYERIPKKFYITKQKVYEHNGKIYKMVKDFLICLSKRNQNMYKQIPMYWWTIGNSNNKYKNGL